MKGLHRASLFLLLVLAVELAVLCVLVEVLVLDAAGVDPSVLIGLAEVISSQVFRVDPGTAFLGISFSAGVLIGLAALVIYNRNRRTSDA